MNNKFTKLFFIVLWGWVLTGTLFAQDPLALRAIVDKTALAVNQQLLLTIELSGKDANKVELPDPPDMGGFFRFMGSGGTSQNIQFINGKMSVTKSQKYYYMAVKEGTYTIPAMTVSLKNDQVSSQPVKLTILKADEKAQAQPGVDGKSQQAAGATSDELFIRGIVNKKKVYQNEPVIVTYRVFIAAGLGFENYVPSKLPENVGFWAEEVDLGTRPKVWEEVINGKKYVLADIKKQVLFPTSPGKKTIGELAIDCNIRVPQRRNNRDIFNDFFDNSFFSRTVTKTIFSKPLDIEVMALPQAGKPANFSGLVGDFKMSASLDKNHVTTNEAITLKIDIAGSGNIKMIPEPELSFPGDFEQYAPKSTESISRQQTGVTGTKSFEFVLVPRFPGEQHIKPYVLTFFDLKDKTYKTLTTPEFVIQVDKGNDEFVAVNGSGLSKEEVRLVGQDIRFIKLAQVRVLPLDYRIYKSFSFYAVIIFPLLLLMGSIAYNKHLEKMSGNVAYARSRRANAMALKHLSKAKKLLSENTQKEYYAAVSKALLGFAADKLNLAEAGIISTELESHLKNKNVEPQVIQQYLELVQHCDYQRFAPANVKLYEMEAFLGKAKEAIISLEKTL